MSEAVPRGKSRGRVFSACAAGTFVSSAPPARPGPGGPADPGGPAPALSPLVTPPYPSIPRLRRLLPRRTSQLAPQTPRESRLAWYPAAWGSHPCGEAGCDPGACVPCGVGRDRAFTLVPCPGLGQVASPSGGLRVGSRTRRLRPAVLGPGRWKLAVFFILETLLIMSVWMWIIQCVVEEMHFQ